MECHTCEIIETSTKNTIACHYGKNFKFSRDFNQRNIEKHNTDILKMEFFFVDDTDFKNWMNKIQENYFCDVKILKTKGNIVYYVCNRSGFTAKRFKKEIFLNDRIKISGIFSFNHNIDPSKVHLSNEIKNLIISMLNDKKSINDIFDKILTNALPNSKEEYACRTDIYNWIDKSGNYKYNENKFLSFDELINVFESRGVIFFAKEFKSEHNEEDCMLGFQTSYQKQLMIQNTSQGGIGLDSTFSIGAGKSVLYIVTGFLPSVTSVELIYFISKSKVSAASTKILNYIKKRLLNAGCAV
uniref:Restriction endonuclease n=1 Tax=Strongyloides venezuelensis TaxID=75913 RepID=A0A0K0FZC7_STRVS